MFLRKFQYSLFALLLSLIVFSCQKAEIIEPTPTLPTSSSEINSRGVMDDYAYYLDDVIVKPETFNLGDSTLFFLVEGGDENAPAKTMIRAYTSVDLMNAYGDLKGWQFSLIYEMEQHLAEYAQKSGAIEAFDKNGKVPEWFLEYQNNYIYEKLGGGEKSIMAILFEHADQGGLLIPTLPLVGLPHLLFLNNKVSSFMPLLIGGKHFVYDRAFYRKRIVTFAGFFGAYSTINFNGPLSFVNDKATSWWSIGL